MWGRGQGEGVVPRVTSQWLDSRNDPLTLPSPPAGERNMNFKVFRKMGVTDYEEAQVRPAHLG
jgi:hypothetical protein